MSEESRPRLGRGLAALLGDTADETVTVEKARGQKRVPIEFLRRNPKNPRRTFDDAQLDDLANSIREKGIIQPIVVRVMQGMSDAYEIVAGERRWRAAQRAGLHEVPIIVIEATDKESLELAIIENVQRADLNPIEEAMGYEQLASEFAYSQSDLARVIGKSRSHVANTLRLLKLPEYSRKLLTEGALSAGHARALLAVDNPDAVAKRAVEQGMTVRDLERIAQHSDNAAVAKKPKDVQEKDADTRALEKALTDVLGLMVTIRHRGQNGELSIRYKSLDQLDALCKRLQT